MLYVKYEIRVEISCKKSSLIFFAVLSKGWEIDKIGTFCIKFCFAPQLSSSIVQLRIPRLFFQTKILSQKLSFKFLLTRPNY